MKIPSLKNLSSNRYLIHRHINRFLFTNLKDKNFSTVVDIGAGKAPYKKFINCEKYILVDLEKRGQDEIVVSDLNKRIALSDGVADLVICTEVLEHLKNPQIALNEIYRILKPKGVLILTTPMTWELHEPPNDFFRFTKFGLEYLLKQAGFTKVVTKPSNNYLCTLCQLSVMKMGNVLLAPVIVGVNVLGVLSSKFGRNYDLPLGFYVRAIK